VVFNDENAGRIGWFEHNNHRALTQVHLLHEDAKPNCELVFPYKAVFFRVIKQLGFLPD
jgi:hypothetical protein